MSTVAPGASRRTASSTFSVISRFWSRGAAGASQERPTEASAARWKTASGCAARTAARTAPASSSSSSAGGHGLLAHPLDRGADPLPNADPRLPAEQLVGLLHRRPAPRHVHLEAGLALQLEVVRILAAGVPHDARDLFDGELLRPRDVEVLVLARGAGHSGHDPLGDVVDVRERARLLARSEDPQRSLAGEHLPD